MHPMFQPNSTINHWPFHKHTHTNVFCLCLCPWGSLCPPHTSSLSESHLCFQAQIKSNHFLQLTFSSPAPDKVFLLWTPNPILHCSGLSTHSLVTTLVERSLLHLSLFALQGLSSSLAIYGHTVPAKQRTIRSAVDKDGFCYSNI